VPLPRRPGSEPAAQRGTTHKHTHSSTHKYRDATHRLIFTPLDDMERNSETRERYHTLICHVRLGQDSNATHRYRTKVPWIWFDTTALRLVFRSLGAQVVDCVWNVMAQAQKPDFFFRRNRRVHLYRRGHQFSRLMAAELCASAVVMLGTPSSEVLWRVLATHSIRQFALHFLYRASPCAITFQLDSTSENWPRDTAITLNFSSLWRKWYTAGTRKLTDGSDW